MEENYFDIAFSFAGEDRSYVEPLAAYLNSLGCKVFYDNYYTDYLFGKELITELRDIYSNKARYCAIFISEHYVSKKWTNNVERIAILEKSISSQNDFILPILMDNSWISGLPTTISYLRADKMLVNEIGDIIYKKVIGKRKIDIITEKTPTYPPKASFSDSERSEFSTLCIDFSVIGFMCLFNHKSKFTMYKYAGYSQRIRAAMNIASLLKTYNIVEYDYYDDGHEHQLIAKLTEKGRRFLKWIQVAL